MDDLASVAIDAADCVRRSRAIASKLKQLGRALKVAEEGLRNIEREITEQKNNRRQKEALLQQYAQQQRTYDCSKHATIFRG
ncbi:MAG: hypothetical protein AAF950_12045 [Pseudomonadota bacterium]